MPGVACQKHGLQDKKPCPECEAIRKGGGRLMGKARQLVRARVLRRYGNQCAALDDGERCPCHAPLEIHHIDGNAMNNSDDNLVPLCVMHHHQLQGDRFATFAEPPTPFVI